MQILVFRLTLKIMPKKVYFYWKKSNFVIAFFKIKGVYMNHPLFLCYWTIPFTLWHMHNTFCKIYLKDNYFISIYLHFKGQKSFIILDLWILRYLVYCHPRFQIKFESTFNKIFQSHTWNFRNFSKVKINFSFIFLKGSL